MFDFIYSSFVVCLNDTPLALHKIHGVTKKQLSFHSIPQNTTEKNWLNLKISKKNILKTIEQNCNPYDGLVEDSLLNMDINYVDYSE